VDKSVNYYNEIDGNFDLAINKYKKLIKYYSVVQYSFWGLNVFYLSQSIKFFAKGSFFIAAIFLVGIFAMSIFINGYRKRKKTIKKVIERIEEAKTSLEITLENMPRPGVN
jgi:predicted ferric reductase